MESQRKVFYLLFMLGAVLELSQNVCGIFDRIVLHNVDQFHELEWTSFWLLWIYIYNVYVT